MIDRVLLAVASYTVRFVAFVLGSPHDDEPESPFRRWFRYGLFAIPVLAVLTVALTQLAWSFGVPGFIVVTCVCSLAYVVKTLFTVQAYDYHTECRGDFEMELRAKQSEPK